MKVAIKANRSCPYCLEEGINSSTEMYTMIPATIEKIEPSTKSFIKGLNNRNAINAPIGSAMPDNKAAFKAFSFHV